MEYVKDDFLEDSKNVNEESNMHVVEDEMVLGYGIIVPYAGIMFKDEKEVFDFYKRYVYKAGFSVRKMNSRKDDDEVLRYVTFTLKVEKW